MQKVKKFPPDVFTQIFKPFSVFDDQVSSILNGRTLF